MRSPYVVVDMNGIPLVNDEAAYIITRFISTATYIAKLAAGGSADSETVETREVVANGVIIIIPP